MGVRLMVEVLDHAPSDLAPADRLLLVAIAESANDQTREGWPGLKLLAHRTGLKPQSVSQALRRLAKRGLELRVPLRLGSDGRPVYAHEKHRTTYRIPPLAQRPDPGRPSEPLPESALPPPEALPGSEEALPGTGRGPTVVGPFPSKNPQEEPSSLLSTAAHTTGAAPEERGEDRQEQNPGAPEVPSVPGVPPALVAEVMEKTTATAEEFAQIIADARRAGIQTPGPWLRSETGAANFIQRLEDLRATVPGPIHITDHWAALRATCEHGTPGGADRCALCRTPAERPPAAEVPQPRSDEPAPPVGQSIAALRALIGSKRTEQPDKPPPPVALPKEQDPAVKAAYDRLNRLGNYDHWWTAARKELPDAHRDEVALLADRLAHSAPQGGPWER